MTLRAVSSSVPPGKQSQYILALGSAPVYMAPNGTVATNGIVTLGTALRTTYSAGIWLRLPANAIVGGSAGMYWAVMSSTTQGQVYTNFNDASAEFIPAVPSGALVAAVGSNAAYTQTTGADVSLVTVPVPGGSLGSKGVLRFNGLTGWNNSAGAKTPKLLFGGTAILSATRTTTTNDEWLYSLRNTSTTTQIGTTASVPQSASSIANRTINTAINQAYVFSGQLAVATDYIGIEAFDLVLLP